ncbi:MAG: alpha/beta hydrolase family protein [Bacilli bacterium]
MGKSKKESIVEETPIEVTPVEEAPVEETPKKKKRKFSLLFYLILSLCMIFTGAIGAQAINENGYHTDVSSFTIPTNDGQWVEGRVFKPDTATSANPAPAVIFVPGFQRTKESHYDIALEIARRGMVCFIIDPYNQGDSSASMNTSSSSAEGGAYGAIPLVNYLYDTGNVNYIQKDNIHLVGHSAGGNSTLTAGVYFSNLAGGVFENCKIKSIYVSGYIRNIIEADVETDEEGNTLFDEEGYVMLGSEGVDWEGSKVANLAINVGFGYALNDEGAWQNINKTGDITRKDSFEALALATSGGVHKELRQTGIEDGKVYGQPSDGTMKVGYQEHTLHGVQPFDVAATSHILYFLDYVTMAGSTLSPNNQIWMFKQMFQLVMLVGLFLSIVPICGLIAKIPVFKSATRVPTAAIQDPPKSKKTWIVWAITLLIGASVACFSFVPLADLSKTIFVEANAHKVTWFFPERMNNAVMLWAGVNGTVGLILFFLTWFFVGRKDGQKLSNLGLNIGLKGTLSTIAIALLTFTSFFFIVHLMDYLFSVDARFTFLAIRVTNKRYLTYMLMYLPLFFIYYFSLSLRINTSSITTNNRKVQIGNYAIAVLMNTLGLFAIFAIQYLSIANHGLMYWTTNWLYTNMLWILIPLMFILPILQKKIYQHTNNVWLAALTTCLIFIAISMCNSVAHGYFNF